MTSTYVLSRRRTQPNINEIAENQARTLLGYVKKFTISQDVLRTDPTKMANMLATHQASTDPRVIKEDNPYHFGTEEADRLLEEYNNILRQEPGSYEDHFVHYHYAFSASILYNAHKIAPHFRKWANFKAVFDRRFAELQDTFLRNHSPRTAAIPSLPPIPVPPQLAPGAVFVPLTMTDANDFLSNPISLVGQVFMSNLGTEDASQWKVVTITIKEGNKMEYGVQFADIDCSLPMEQNELLHLMMLSSRICRSGPST